MKVFKKKNLNYYKMLQEIDKLTDTDFVADMEYKEIYTEKESQKMAKLLSDIYSIAHCIHCVACQKKYESI